MKKVTACVFTMLFGLCLFAMPITTQAQELASHPPAPNASEIALRGVPQVAFGTTSYTVVPVGAYAFQPFRQTGSVTGVNDDGNGYSWITGGALPLLVADVQIPSGAIVDYIGLHYCDNTASGSFNMTLYDLKEDGEFSTVSYLNFPDHSGCFFYYNQTPANYTWGANSKHLANLYLWQYDVYDGTIKFRGAEVWYRLQVSPAPSTATFSDVPVGAPFFQEIEALADSGITSGFQDGTFRPNQYVSRAAVAAWLAKALGLHWPN